MAYYVSVIHHDKKMLAAGPFETHGEALNTVGAVRHLVKDRAYKDHAWFGYGTCHVKTGHPAAKFSIEELAPFAAMCTDKKWW